MAIERSIRINVEAGRAKAELRSLQGSLRDTDRAAGAAATASRALGAAIAGFASLATIRQVAEYADTYTNLQNQLKLVTGSTEELSSVTESLFAIAQRTRNGIEGTSDLYARLARSTEDLGISNERLLSVTESVNQAVSISGTTAASAQAALFQLGQGLGAGALRGEELNSVLEQTPRLAKAIADGLGITIAELRDLGKEGELTAQRVISALESQASVLSSEYAQTSSTIEQAFTKINNELIKYVGEADKANGITKTITNTLDIFGNNFSEIADTILNVAVPAFTALSTVIASRLVGSVVSYTTKIAATTAAQLTATKATAGLSAALGVQRARLTSATVAANAYTIAARGANAVLAALGGPAGIAITAAGALAIYLSTVESAEEKTARLNRETKDYIDTLEGASIIQFTTALFNAEEAVDAAKQELAENNNELERLISVGAESSKVTEDLRVKISQLEANVINAELEVKRISGTFQEAAKSAREFAGAAAGDDNTKNPELLAAAYRKLKGELDEATKIQNEFEDTVKEINKDFPEGAKRVELLRLAEKKRDEDLKRLNDRLQKSADRNAKLHRSYLDLRGELDQSARAVFDYNELMKEIARSTASSEEKTKLQALAFKQLKDNIDDATVTAQEFLAQFNPIAAAEVRRTELLRQLEDVQTSASEKQKLATEIQRQYNKAVDDAVPSFVELNAQFSAADAATAAYVETLKQLDEAERLGVDTTELRTNALRAYIRAAEEGRKQDVLNAETSQSFFGAFKQGIMDTALTAESSYDQIREVGRNAVNGLADQITQFISTGKADFKSFASSVIAELLKIQTQALIVQALTGTSFGSFLGFTAARGAAFEGGVKKFARGGASMPLSAFSGSVVSTPTKFAVGGTVGQMGEAGAEAILPLQKTSSGELGVRAEGASQQPAPNVNVDVPVQVINVTERPQDYIGSDAGVKQILNIMTQNKAVLQS